MVKYFDGLKPGGDQQECNFYFAFAMEETAVEQKFFAVNGKGFCQKKQHKLLFVQAFCAKNIVTKTKLNRTEPNKTKQNKTK